MVKSVFCILDILSFEKGRYYDVFGNYIIDDYGKCWSIDSINNMNEVYFIFEEE